MPTTPLLALPLLAAAQAQKHVTHNEAIAALDALLHLSVRERDRTNPPAAPEEADRYLVGEDGIGAFAGHAQEIAQFDLGSWRFLAPNPGWRAFVENEEQLLVFTGTAWRALTDDTPQFARLGIGTAADDVNHLAAKLNAALFTARSVDEGGSGDLRIVMNKSASGNVLSQLYQRDYQGRAETGLIGDDDFAIRVSSDGVAWRDAMRISAATGIVSFPSGLSGVPGANWLINSGFVVNQRKFAGGALAAGAYGFDRWKAGSGGCTLALASDRTVSLTGALEQVVDVAQAPALVGAADFSGCTLTFSVENLSGSLSVTIAGSTLDLPPGSGRRSVTVTLPTVTGHLTLRLQASDIATFARPKLEAGPVATPWQGDWLEAEETRCRRYYQRVPTSGTSPLSLGAFGQRKGANAIEIPITLPVAMRASPSVSTSGFFWSSASPGGNQIGFFDPALNAWLGVSGGLGTGLAAPASANALVLRVQAASAFTGAAGAVGQLHLGPLAFIALQAEL